MKFTRIPYSKERRRRDEEHLKDVEFFNKNSQELMKQHPEQWIGILGQQVVGSAASEEELIVQLEARGFRWDLVFRSHLTRKEENLIASNWDAAAAIEEWQIAGMISRMRDD